MKTYAMHWAIGGGAALLASAAARALPEPQPLGSRFYLFLYRFAQNLLANFDKSAAQKPQ
jgi:hypothetical protein